MIDVPRVSPRIEALFSRAVEDPEIKPHLSETISRGALQRAVRKAQNEIVEAVGADLRLENAELALAEKLKAERGQMIVRDIHGFIEKSNEPIADLRIALSSLKYDSRKGATARAITDVIGVPATSRFEMLLGFFGLIFLGALLALGIGLLAYLIFGAGWAAFTSAPWVGIAAAVGGLAIGGAGTTLAAQSLVESRAKTRSMSKAEELISEVQARSAERDAEIAEAKRRAGAITQKVEEGLYAAVVRVLRREIDTARADDYSSLLPNIIPRGLAESYNATSDFVTPAREKLDRYLQNMPNGSIGIAGSRGAGKSTLLRTFAAKQKILRRNENGDVDELPVLSVNVSTPVQYDAREFIMHLFSSLCVSVRNHFGDKEELRASSDSKPETGTEWKPVARRIASVLVNFTAAVGIVLLSIAIVATVSMAGADDVKKNAYANLGIKPVELGVQALIWIAASALLLVVRSSVKEELPQKSEDPPRLHPLLEQARRHTMMIRFQRGYSADWNAGASFAGLSAGVKEGTSYQEQRLTLPEVVARYTEFVTSLTSEFVVIIAIDELDKIASDEKAQQFINDIKALFGIPKCFYLITVSDHAMSSFSRRGLPVRDAFDSALDEVVRVEHMDMPTAQKLLAGRVIGLPIPYLALCYCHSAGLPRDLIRSCRDVFEIAERLGPNTPRDLGHIAKEIFREDLVAKIHGTITAITALRKGAAATGVLDALWTLVADAEKRSMHLGDYEALAELAASTEDKDVRALANDLASYLYYLITVPEIIALQQRTGNWTAAVHARLFEELAGLRRYIGVDSVAAASAITRLRALQGLRTPSAPKPPSAASDEAPLWPS